MPDAESQRFCPQCRAAQMMLLKRIVHDDGSATTYFRCHNCSNLEVCSPPRLPPPPRSA